MIYSYDTFEMARLLDRVKFTQGVRNKRLGALLKIGKDGYYGFNQLKTHRLQAQFCDKPEKIYLHAETDAIRQGIRNYQWMQMPDILKSFNADLYVCRLKVDGSIGMAKPCDGCMSCAVHMGIRRVVYTTDSGEYKDITL